MTVVSLGVPSVHRPVGPAPADGPLVDTFGRVATDLRVSLTDLCNLRCTYCMPAEGLDWMPSDQKLHAGELMRLLRLAVTRLGITSVRFTGGEPLVVPHLEELVAATAALRPRPEITLTTNGVGLARRAATLREAGLDRINVSLDTVDAARFAAITRRDRLDDVLAGLRAAKDAGLHPVKVNAVLDPVSGRADAVELLRFCLEHGYQLRIIEQMPLDAGHSWQRDRVLDAAEILTALRRHFTLQPDPQPRGSAPAQLWQVVEGTRVLGRVGIIASVSQAFCASCDRSRLTADGQVRNCLFARDETDLRALLRSGADDAALEAAWRQAMWSKAAGHGINDPDFVQPTRPMSAIGG
ncbi:GTP 3',8-cyclase MoaA [Mycolicibacterium duvalii]|uniref:GTP 3',8-cyclase n=1 Tax=Mycolicibacterium duvalii TaxID=39688 RepID=A0A7I7K9J5_9MYCO|nr:GTP 3',8-cyclase MoaA [Mycolicibacterium duvalii]MCV7366447.1 GTP 3',8-cyclase MoaA [Mycolicibacterium duvalii]PEG43766.1 GTP 3',8-cyclase MoaA [Mycolicibacterium duvalii]BBX20274.1 GTP 3',8-cyclase [Mycolicibacterium duvalii]